MLFPVHLNEHFINSETFLRSGHSSKYESALLRADRRPPEICAPSAKRLLSTPTVK